MVSGTQVAYWHLCHRKLWLFSKNIQLEHQSELVATGKFIDEHAYPQRAARWQALELEKVKIDHFDAQLGIVREVKKSNKQEVAHRAQLLYYMWVLEQHEISVNYGILEYPRLRLTEKVYLTEENRRQIPSWIKATQQIINEPICPPIIQKSICKRCAYFEFCYIE